MEELTDPPLYLSKQFGMINCASLAQVNMLKAELMSQGYTVIDLNGAHVRDKASFLSQAAVDLPQPRDLISKSNWDAFADSFWWGLASLDGTQFAIVWTNAEQMLHSGLGDLLTALSCFVDVANSIRNVDHGFPRASKLIVFLVGEGPNFPLLNL